MVFVSFFDELLQSSLLQDLKGKIEGVVFRGMDVVDPREIVNKYATAVKKIRLILGEDIIMAIDIEGSRAYMADLPKARDIIVGEIVTLVPKDKSDSDGIPIGHFEILWGAVKERTILETVRDPVKAEVFSKGVDWIKVLILQGDKLNSRQGIGIQGVGQGGNLLVLDDKDRALLRFAKDNNFDVVILSMASSASCIKVLWEEEQRLGVEIAICGKLEDKAALEAADSILLMPVCAGVLIGRKDLKIALGEPRDMPKKQWELIEKVGKVRRLGGNKLLGIGSLFMPGMVEQNTANLQERSEVFSLAKSKAVDFLYLRGEFIDSPFKQEMLEEIDYQIKAAEAWG